MIHAPGRGRCQHLLNLHIGRSELGGGLAQPRSVASIGTGRPLRFQLFHWVTYFVRRRRAPQRSRHIPGRLDAMLAVCSFHLVLIRLALRDWLGQVGNPFGVVLAESLLHQAGTFGFGHPRPP